MGVCAPCVVNELLAQKDDQQPTCDSVSEWVTSSYKGDKRIYVSDHNGYSGWLIDGV